MADYQKMYNLLCSAASEAIDAPPEKAKRLLQNALYAAEEIYIHTCGGDREETKPQVSQKSNFRS